MTTPVYISTLGSDIKNNQPIRDMFETLTQEYLNQGGKITQLDSRVSTDAAPTTMTPHNKRVAIQKKKERDALVEDVINLLEQGMVPSAIQSKLKINHKAYTKLIKENGIEDFAKGQA